jgi:plastocyanin
MKRGVLLLIAACGGGSDSPSVDAAPDTPPPKVVALSSCPATVNAMIMDSDTKFIPNAVTVPAGGTVKISTTAEHFVIPNISTTSDPALMVSRNQTVCFKFNATGSYGIACGVHGFVATITVQ